MNKILNVLGTLSILFGCVAVALCFFPKWLFFAILSAFFGMICSTSFVFLVFKYSYDTRKFTPALIGIILSSVPIVFVVVANFIRH